MDARDWPERGGIASLAALIKAHGEAVEADLLLRTPHRLRDLYCGMLSYRELALIVRYLPPESATKTALREEAEDAGLDEEQESIEPGRGSWSKDQMLLAALVDAVRGLGWLYVSAHSKHRPPPPEPVPRPGAVLSRKEKRKLLKAIDALERIRANHGGS